MSRVLLAVFCWSVQVVCVYEETDMFKTFCNHIMCKRQRDDVSELQLWMA